MKKKRGRRRGGLNKLQAGAIALAVIALFTYLGFTKFANPFANPYTVHVIFNNANGLAPASLVRIGGVNVGKVENVQPAANCKNPTQTESQCSAADVSMTLNSQGLPLHKDATFAIRPRIFLEGNFFVDVHPGSPEAPIAPSGWVFKPQQGTSPVQFDQLLTSLQAPTRRDLQILLQQYGTAVKQGGPSYNQSIQYWQPAYQYSATVAHDSLGLQPHDLSNWLYRSGDVAAALDAHPPNLENFVTDFNITANAFARQSANLQRAVADLPTTLHVALPALTALDNAICAPPFQDIRGGAGCAPGSLIQFAHAFIPGVKSTNPMINASLPFISQLRQLVQPSELGGLTDDLSKTVPALTKLTKETIPLLSNQVQPAAGCVVNDIYPWSQLTLNDPNFNASNGFPPHKVYVEGADFLPGLAGESRNEDANGMYIRIMLALGNAGVTSLQSGLVGSTGAPFVGEQPQEPAGGHPPPFVGAGGLPNYPCQNQPPITDLSTPSAKAPPSYPIVGTLPSSLVSTLQSVGSSLPLGLSKDAATRKSGAKAGSSSNYKPLTPAQRAADLQTLGKTGIWEIYPKLSSTPSSTATQSSGKASTGQ